MKKSVFIFAAAAALSLGMIVYGWIFVDGIIGGTVLTEETQEGSRDMADGLGVSFKSDSAGSLSWSTGFDYGTGRTVSSFKRGKTPEKTVPAVYDDIRFTGMSEVPYVTRLEYDRLRGLQDKKIHNFYDEIQHRVIKTGIAEKGEIRLAEYLDCYPVSFRFQLGTKIYSSKNALVGLKLYDTAGTLSEESAAVYDDDIKLYTAFNDMFRIPVIENEYSKYRISKAAENDEKTSPGYIADISKPLGFGKDCYEFDPIIAIQEENVIDGKKWIHPDLSGGLSYEAGGSGSESFAGKKASDYNLKNRMLFIVNNRTAKGRPVDVSKIKGGFGVYELPIAVTASATVTKNPKSWTVPNPEPVTDGLKMVYPLDEKAEYVEISLSPDHRYLAAFSVEDGSFFAELIDADKWSSQGSLRLFPATKNTTYAWGGDGSLALTNHSGCVAVLALAENEDKPYEIVYSGKPGNGFDDAFFDTETVFKKNSRAIYKYGVDRGLAIAVKDGRAALVQNPQAGGFGFDFRNPGLECAVIDKTGVLYRGRLKSSVADFGYDMSREQINAASELLGADKNGKPHSNSKLMKQLIKPVRSENRAEWQQ